MSRASLGATLPLSCAAISTARAADSPDYALARVVQSTVVESRSMPVYLHVGRFDSMRVARPNTLHRAPFDGASSQDFPCNLEAMFSR